MPKSTLQCITASKSRRYAYTVYTQRQSHQGRMLGSTPAGRTGLARQQVRVQESVPDGSETRQVQGELLSNQYSVLRIRRPFQVPVGPAGPSGSAVSGGTMCDGWGWIGVSLRGLGVNPRMGENRMVVNGENEENSLCASGLAMGWMGRGRVEWFDGGTVGACLAFISG